MKEIRIRHIMAYAIRVVVACAACLVLHGCVSGSLPDEDDSDDIVQVGFRIRLGGGYGTQLPESRTAVDLLPPDYGDPTKYETGTGYENYIDIAGRDFRFLLFDSIGRFVETMTVLGIYPVGDDLYPSDYTVLCSLAKKPDATFRIVALANWGDGNYPRDAELTAGVTTIRDVCVNVGKTYAYVPPFTPSPETSIPMYGVKTYTLSSATDRHIDIGDLYLLRAMAKVEVACKAGSGLELSSVQLTGYNTKGFCAPNGMEDNTGYVSEPHIPDDAVNGNAPIDFKVSADKGKAVIYLPEYNNTGAGPNCRLSVTFADNTDRHYTVYFREYIDGNPTGGWLDILRNCCYRFTVDKKDAEFEVDLSPYGVVDLNPDFGISIN